MDLSKILQGIDFEGTDIPFEIDIKDIAYDSKNTGEGIAFVCIPGVYADGHDFVETAYQNGSRIFFLQKDIDLPEDAIKIYVKDTRKTLSKISANFFEQPSEKLAVIGVTGTKGKTTTTHIIKDILDANGIKTGLIGTIGASWGNEYKSTLNTTPESYESQKLLRKMLNDGCKAVAMEVSSIGIMAHRVDDIHFSIGVFTNISPDHIGGYEHKSFSEYYHYKKEMFKHCDDAIGFIDDEAAKDMLSSVRGKKIFYGSDMGADYRANNISLLKNKDFFGVKFDLMKSNEIYKNIKISLPGDYNVYNALAAIAVCEQFGINIEDMRDILKNIKVKGRAESVLITDDYDIIIDYAHNGISLINLLRAIREYNPKRVICLYGSVGGRSNVRREEMGHISGKMCDLSILTSDDPNFENPDDIINEIAQAVVESGGKYIAIPNREEAINYAISILEKGDILILAGKGHEKYQKMLGNKVPFSERECCIQALKSRNDIKT